MHRCEESFWTKRIRLVCIIILSIFAFVKWFARKILNFFAWITLDNTKHFCYTMYEHLKRGAFMAISERIHFFRNLRGMTQKYLGLQLGFPDKSADVRMAQYETGSRTPKADITAALAQVLDVAPEALNVPDIDSYIGLAHTFFALEDIYGITVSEADGELCLKVNAAKGKDAAEIIRMLAAWNEQKAKLDAGEIDKETYDQWRYHYPKFDTTGGWVKVLSQELSDAMVEAFKDRLKPD